MEFVYDEEFTFINTLFRAETVGYYIIDLQQTAISAISPQQNTFTYSSGQEVCKVYWYGTEPSSNAETCVDIRYFSANGNNNHFNDIPCSYGVNQALCTIQRSCALVTIELQSSLAYLTLDSTTGILTASPETVAEATVGIAVPY